MVNKQALVPATKAALSDRKALIAGFQSIKQRPLCTNTAEEICFVIKQTELIEIPYSHHSRGIIPGKDKHYCNLLNLTSSNHSDYSDSSKGWET